MKLEMLTPEHQKVMAEYPGLNQRQWWLVSDLTDRLAAEVSRREQAEEVVDNCLKHPRIYSTTDSGAMAKAYRQRFPRESTGEG